MRRLITALLLAVGVGPTWASVDAELNNMFVDMSNFTAPGVWNSQRRGVISGGGFVARNRIANINLMSIVPPSFEAGCGGINVYGGSFSFINKEQFVGLMRNIASNAMGYAFQLALNSMCESCMQTIETLARKVQQMNQNMGNSCQMAQGIVNDTLSGMSVKGKTDASLLATLKGFGDYLESSTTNNSAGTSPAQTAQNIAPADTAKLIKGNLVWRQLRHHGATAWFASGDTSLLEAVMSVSGTVVVGDLVDDGKGGKSNAVTVFPGNRIRLIELIKGGTLKLYKCDRAGEDECLSPTLVNNDLKGMQQRVLDTLLGDSAGTGLIAKAASNTEPTAAEKSFLAALPSGMGGMIVRLAGKSPDVAKVFVRQWAPYISMEMAAKLMTDMMDAARAAAMTEDNAYAKKLSEVIAASQADVRGEMIGLQTEYGGADGMVQHYNNVLQAFEKQKYLRPHTQTAATE
jgi:conjugative transfer pilus assembly protein TraH